MDAIANTLPSHQPRPLCGKQLKQRQDVENSKKFDAQRLEQLQKESQNLDTEKGRFNAACRKRLDNAEGYANDHQAGRSSGFEAQHIGRWVLILL